MSGFREPGYLWRLKIPFIWGPVGGTENASWHLISEAGVWGAIMEGMRNLINNLQFKYSMRIKKAMKKALVIVAANSDGKEKFKKIHKIDTILLPNNGIQSVITETEKTGSDQRAIRILWSSRMTHHKCLPLLLRALSGMPKKYDYELRILGDGPQRRRWRMISHQLRIEQQCNWMGWLPYDQARKQYEWADVFVFTSLRDTLATVVLEALGYGVPVICLDHSGSRDVVTDQCGIKIQPGERNEVVSRLRGAIMTIADDRGKLEALSWGAIKRAQNYLWLENGKQMAQLYNKLLTSQI